MTFQTKEIPPGFDLPTALPQTTEQAAKWQACNLQWWESHPMRYDWKDELGAEDFSSKFYEEIDRRFFHNAEEYLPARKLPFDRLIPFDDLPHLDVLEIGVGNDSHAGLLARHARTFTGIDLTDYAVNSTRQRLRLARLDAPIIRMDAEKMDFPDESFDFLWSWGVIHHSADTGQVLREMRRVLRPGGRAVIMVYHRNFWNYYVWCGLLHGFLRGMWFQNRSLHRIMQVTNDGALARFYTRSEWKTTVSDCFEIDTLEVFGPKSHLLPLPASRLKDVLLRLFPDGLSRFFANRLRMGSFLVARMRRVEDTPKQNSKP